MGSRKTSSPEAFGILLSAAALYYFPKVMGVDTYLESKHADKINRIKSKIDHPYGILFVIGWAFFPLVPTDLICYAAGAVRMDIRRLLLGIFLGELPLVMLYISGSNLLSS